MVAPRKEIFVLTYYVFLFKGENKNDNKPKGTSDIGLEAKRVYVDEILQMSVKVIIIIM